MQVAGQGSMKERCTYRQVAGMGAWRLEEGRRRGGREQPWREGRRSLGRVALGSAVLKDRRLTWWRWQAEADQEPRRGAGGSQLLLLRCLAQEGCLVCGRETQSSCLLMLKLPDTTHQAPPSPAFAKPSLPFQHAAASDSSAAWRAHC